jgi:hypothetical protein
LHAWEKFKLDRGDEEYKILTLKGKLWRIAGWLLALNGAACMIGIFGITIQNDVLSLASLIGGVLFLAALFPLGLAFWHEETASFS